MSQSLTMLTAALLVGQTPFFQSGNKDCPCKNGTQSVIPGRVVAQPDYESDMRAVGWFPWRNSGSTTTTTSNNGRTTTTVETWNSSSPSGETSWIDNRPVLSRIKNLFGRGESAPTRTETITQPELPRVITQPANSEYYRRLPTSSEPPLQRVPAQPVVQPKVIAPTSQKPAPATTEPLTIEISPIEFRRAGEAKGRGAVDTFVQPAIEPSTVTVIAPDKVPPSRPNPINARFVNKVGQPGDYSWITGQLEVRGNQYILHYATPETIDRYNGSIVLHGADLRRFQSGDLISAHGNVVQQGRGQVYQVSAVDLVER